MTDFIRPAHSIHMWASDNILHLELPSLHGAKSHFLKLPLNVYGLTQAVEIVKARHSESRIGERGDMTQAQAEKEMADLARKIDPTKITRPKPTMSPEKRSIVQDVLRRLGAI